MMSKFFSPIKELNQLEIVLSYFQFRAVLLNSVKDFLSVSLWWETNQFLMMKKNVNGENIATYATFLELLIYFLLMIIFSIIF